MHVLRSLFLVGLFGLAFLVTARVVRGVLGWPEASGLREKLVHYESDAEGFDVVFVGSSNVMNSIQPELFDAVLAERGHAIRSYNLGVPGMLAFEVDYLLQEVLADKPDRLRWVFVELTDWRPNDRLIDKSERSVHWHSIERVAAMVQAAWRYEPYDARDRWTFLRDNAVLAAYRLANVGRLQERLVAELGMADPNLWVELIDPAREGGYVALEEIGHPGAEEGRRRFLADREDYKRKLDQLRAQKRPTGPPPEYLQVSADRRLALFTEAGVAPIHVILPACYRTEDLEALGPPAGPMDELWVYNRPDEVPDLFRHPVRYDNRHVQRPGAEIVTRMIAERFADRLERGE